MKALICCDCSTAGEFVLREAHKFLEAFPDGEVHILSVIDMTVVSSAGLYNGAEIIKSLEEQAEEVNKWAQRIFLSRKIEFSTEVAYPTESILEKVRSLNADLLIMGTHGKTGLGRILIGSVAENVLRHVSCNTLIIPVKHLSNG